MSSPTIIRARDIEAGDVISIKFPPAFKRNKVTFRVSQSTDLAVTGWGVKPTTLAETHQHKMVSRTSAELSEVYLIQKGSK